MSLSLSINLEVVCESNALHDQEFQEEIEDLGRIIHQEALGDREYYQLLGKYHSGRTLLDTSSNLFVFRGINPSSLGKTKKEMYEQTYINPYDSKVFLYASKQIEYYAYGQRFNKVSRRWSYYPDYLDALLQRICHVEKVLRNVKHGIQDQEQYDQEQHDRHQYERMYEAQHKKELERERKQELEEEEEVKKNKK
jgi:ribosomal protein S21